MCIPDEWQHLQPGDLRPFFFFPPCKTSGSNNTLASARSRGAGIAGLNMQRVIFWLNDQLSGLSHWVMYIFLHENLFSFLMLTLFPCVAWVFLIHTACMLYICVKYQITGKKTLMWKYAQMWKCLHVKTAETKLTLVADQTRGAGAGQFSQNCGGVKYHRVLSNSCRPAA